MKKGVVFMLLLMLLTVICLPVLADLPAQPNPEGWRYLGYTPAGITFLIPDDTQSYPLTAIDRAEGFLFIGMNADYTIQMRRYQPEQANVAAFKAMLSFTSGAQVEVRNVNGTEVVCYRNGNPTGISELYGIVLTGTDGCMYKISIFTGVDEDFSEDAAVWEIAERIADSVSIVDYSDWPVEQ